MLMLRVVYDLGKDLFLFFFSAGLACPCERPFWLRPRYDERNRVLAVVQSVRTPPIALEHRLDALPDETRRIIRLRQQQEAVWVQAVPRRAAPEIMVRTHRVYMCMYISPSSHVRNILECLRKYFRKYLLCVKKSNCLLIKFLVCWS